VSVKHFVAAVGIAALAASCSDVHEPFSGDVQRDIQVPGNTLGTSGCTTIDRSGCFAILDNQIKILYERNNWAARRGEAEYRVVTNSNSELASIFGAETRTVDEALRYLDRFVAQIATARSGGRMSECWGAHIQGYGEWIRAKVAAGDIDVSTPPRPACEVSPVSVTGAGNETSGVVLTINDPWHFTGDPYNIHTTMTYFVITGPNGTITTTPALQTGAATITVVDALTKSAGAHDYSVVQCADWGYCSAPTRSTITVAVGTTGGELDPGTECVHDNRDKTFIPRTGAMDEKCEKPKLGGTE
jgi:hypothetical protein